LEPGPTRKPVRLRDHQPAAGRDPPHGRDRAAAGGARARRRRGDRRASDHAPRAVLRPPRGGRRARQRLPPPRACAAGGGGLRAVRRAPAPAPERPGLAVEWLGRVPYGEALALQERRIEARRRGEAGDVLLLLEHPPVVTLGRRGDPRHVLATPAALAARGL